MTGKGLPDLAWKLVPAGCILLIAGCSWLNRGKAGAVEPAIKVAQGARIVAVTTARAGALVSKVIAGGTYRGSRKVVTWTSARTVEGTTATLEMLNLIERPVPPDILEELPEELLASLSALEFIKPETEPAKVVISSPDSRWEGEVFYRLERGEALRLRIRGPAELIVVTLAGFAPGREGEQRAEEADYTVYVTEDERELGDIRFESPVLERVRLYGYPGWRASAPGVFVIKALEGTHYYSLNCTRSDSDSCVLFCCFLPRYETNGGAAP